jgi:hypothetical protein
MGPWGHLAFLGSSNERRVYRNQGDGRDGGLIRGFCLDQKRPANLPGRSVGAHPGPVVTGGECSISAKVKQSREMNALATDSYTEYHF